MMTYRTVYFLAFLLTSLLLGCTDEDGDVNSPSSTLFEEQQQTIAQYLDERDIVTQQNAQGIHYRVLTENSSGTAPQPDNIVNLYYRLEQLTGGVIEVLEDSSLAPATYTFGFDRPRAIHLTLPAGLDGMVSLMREGEVYEFYLPSAWAYLDYTLTDVIPANAIVLARIRLAEVLTPGEQRHAEDERIRTYLAHNGLTHFDTLASGVYYVQSEAGSGEGVAEGDRVRLRYTGSLLDGTVFDSNTAADQDLLEFTVGQSNLIDGFPIGVRHMHEGETGTIVIPSHAAYGQGVMAIPYQMADNFLDPRSPLRSIPPYSPLRFDVEVVAVN